MLSGSKSSCEEFEVPSITCQRCSERQSMLYCAGAFPVFRTEIENTLDCPGTACSPEVPAATT